MLNIKIDEIHYLKKSLVIYIKKDVMQGDSDTGIIAARDKMDTNNVLVTEKIVNYDVKLKVDSDTDEETSKIENIVGGVVDEVALKIDDENKENSQVTEINVAHAVKQEDSVQSEVHVVGCNDNVNTDEPDVKPYPVHETLTSNIDDTVHDTVDTQGGNVTQFDSSQPPGKVIEAETVLPPIYINEADNADSGEKWKKSVTFCDDVDVKKCNDDGFMINTYAQLDDTISLIPDEPLVIDEGHSEKSTFEDITVSTYTGNLVEIPGKRCLGGEIPLEDQEGFEDSTPSCSQIPPVDPYKNKSYVGNSDSRYTASAHIFVFFS